MRFQHNVTYPATMMAMLLTVHDVLGISNALQWRLQYNRVSIATAKTITSEVEDLRVQ